MDTYSVVYVLLGLRDRLRREKDRVKILEQKLEVARKEAEDQSKNLESELEKKQRAFKNQQTQYGTKYRFSRQSHQTEIYTYECMYAVSCFHTG